MMTPMLFTTYVGMVFVRRFLSIKLMPPCSIGGSGIMHIIFRDGTLGFDSDVKL